MTRPPPRDQPSSEESAALLAELGEQLAAARTLRGAQVVPSPDRARQVRVRPDGARTHLSLVEHGQVLAERDVDTSTLLEVLGGQATGAFAALASIIESS